MKKYLALILATLVLFALCACGEKPAEPQGGAEQQGSDQPSVHKKTKFILKLDANGGTGSKEVEVEAGSAAQEPSEAPFRKGFTFEGWFANDVKYDFAAPVNGDVTVTAKWTPEPIDPPAIKIQPNDMQTVCGFGTYLYCEPKERTNKYTASYQWYRSDKDSNSGGTAVEGAVEAGFYVPAQAQECVYYYYCEVTSLYTVNGATASVVSEAAKVETKQSGVESFFTLSFKGFGIDAVDAAAVGIIEDNTDAGITVGGKLARLSAAAAGVEADGHYLPFAITLQDKGLTEVKITVTDGKTSKTYTSADFEADGKTVVVKWLLGSEYKELSVMVDLDGDKEQWLPFARKADISGVKRHICFLVLGDENPTAVYRGAIKQLGAIFTEAGYDVNVLTTIGNGYELPKYFDIDAHGNLVEGTLNSFKYRFPILTKSTESYDFVAITTGRFKTLTDESAAALEEKAVLAVEKMAAKHNPNVKFILLASAPCSEYLESEFTGTRAEAAALIEARAEKLAALLNDDSGKADGEYVKTEAVVSHAANTIEKLDEMWQAGKFPVAQALEKKLYPTYGQPYRPRDDVSGRLNPGFISGLTMAYMYYGLAMNETPVGFHVFESSAADGSDHSHYGLAKTYEEALPELTVVQKIAHEAVFGTPYTK